MRSRRIVIAGAGIGGLTAALALAARGHSIVVLEKTAALQAIGAGVQLSPNASRILLDLGLRDALASRASAPDAIMLGSVRAGRPIARFAVAQTRDAPYWVIHRADLQTALAEAVDRHDAIDLRLGQAVTGVTQDGDGVRIAASGSTYVADALIAADGVGSAIRSLILPGSPPVPSGWTAWRGLAPHAIPSQIELWMAPQAHSVAYPVDGGRRTNLVLTLPAHLAATDIPSKLAGDHWPDAPRDLLAAAGPLTPYPLSTVPALRTWTHGRIALLGDAAHALLPFAAQGAAMAIEDAAVLAFCIGDDPDVASALARYAAIRRPRVTRVAAAARQSGHIYHMGWPLSLARDIGIRLIGSARLMRRQDWIYDWKISESR